LFPPQPRKISPVTPSPDEDWSFPRVDLWRIGLEADPQKIRSFYEYLSKDERSKARQFVFERDRRRYIAGRGSLRAILSEYVGIAPSSLRFRYGSRGKPGLDLPSDERLFFNLSHSEELCILAVTVAGEVGADVEHARPLANEETAKLFFSPAETVELLSLSGPQREAGFFNCWTRKEAFLKARGEGLSTPLGSFDVSLKPGEPARLIRTAEDADEAPRWTLKDVEVPAGYYASVALRVPDFELVYRC
jgi:4'-phosphopantetheinyl transferase